MAAKPVTDPVVINMEWVVSGLILSGLALMFYSFFGGLTLIGLAMIMFGYGIKEIPANPPHKGLVTVWGKRTTRVKDEGYRLLAPYFPFFIDVINVQTVTINQDIQVKLFCRASAEPTPGSTTDSPFQVGAEVTLSAGITFKPTATGKDAGIELQQYLNNGGEVGVRSILDDIIPQVLRIEGTKRTFEELTAAKDELINSLFKLTTDEDLASLSSEERIRRLKDVQTNGRKDIHGLGITITKINIGEPQLGDDIKLAAQSRAREELERRGEVYEVETEVRQAQVLREAYQQAGESRSLESCIQEIRRRKSIREGHGQVFDVTGLEGLAGALLSGLGRNNPPTPTQPPASGSKNATVKSTRRRQE